MVNGVGDHGLLSFVLKRGKGGIGGIIYDSYGQHSSMKVLFIVQSRKHHSRDVLICGVLISGLICIQTWDYKQ